jgi:hypothetical protein
MMQFLKKHFEKIILSAVLAGLGAAAVWLSMSVPEVKASLSAGLVSSPRIRALPGVESNLTLLSNAVLNLTSAPVVTLTGEHNLFNPVTWKMRPDGYLFKMKVAGVDGLAVTAIRPLYFTISLAGQAGEGYRVTTQPPSGAKASTQFVRVGEKPTPLRPYTLVGTNAAPGNPSETTIQLLIPETGETVSVTTNSPYKRVAGYEADLKYSGSDATNVFLKKHVEDQLLFSGESFRIIAIASNAVTVQDNRNTRRTVKEWKGGQ